MSVTDQLKNPTALYAVVGAGDLVAEKLRAKRQDLAEQPMQDQLRTLQDKAQALAFDALGQAVELYAELARRGEAVVTRLRAQDATQEPPPPSDQGWE